MLCFWFIYRFLRLWYTHNNMIFMIFISYTLIWYSVFVLIYIYHSNFTPFYPGILWLVHSKSKRLVSGASLAASEASPPWSSSLWSALATQRPGSVTPANQKPGSSNLLQWFPSYPPPGPASVQILCKKKIATKGAMQTTKAEMCNGGVRLRRKRLH